MVNIIILKIFIIGEESSVYNVRGGIIPSYAIYNNVDPSSFYTEIDWKSSDGDEFTDKDSVNLYTFTSDQLINSYENTAGVIYLDNDNLINNTSQSLYSIGMYVPKAVIQYLQSYNIIGMKFVRQKRIPMRICQIYTIPVDGGSNLPLLHTAKNIYQIESFLDSDRKVTQKFSSRLKTVNDTRQIGAICPDYIVKMPYFNQLFTGTKFALKKSVQQNKSGYLYTKSDRIYRVKEHIYQLSTDIANNIYIVGLQDSQPSAAAESKIFRAKAGDASEAYRYRLIGGTQISSDNGTLSAKDLEYSDQIVRGLYSPYLGLSGSINSDFYYDVYYPGWSKNNLKEYMSIRIQDNSEYYPVSDNIDINTTYTSNYNLFRGDNYICNFTWRMNRNFHLIILLKINMEVRQNSST